MILANMASQLPFTYTGSSDNDFEMIDAIPVDDESQEPKFDGRFQHLASLMRKQGDLLEGPIFHTMSDNQSRDHLWDLFNSKLSIHVRQEMNCRSRKHFVG